MALLGAANIKGVSALGLPKISNLVGGIFIPGLLCFSAVVDQREQGRSPGLQNALEVFNRLLEGVFARFVDDSFNC